MTVDVVVVGAGITGALIADALAAAGARIAVLDKRGLARGSTMASTALVQHELDMPLAALARRIGKHNAARAWRRSQAAVEALAARLQELGVADVAHRYSLYLAGNVLGREQLEHEHAARRAAGLSSRLVDRKELRGRFGIARDGAIISYGNLVIDPRKSTLAVLRAAGINGARIFAPVEATKIMPSQRGVTVIAANNNRLQCGELIFATGYELPDDLPSGPHRIASTWAMATIPQKRERMWPGECCIWEASNPYLYVRTTAEGRVICGGEDREIADEEKRKALLPTKTRTLQRKLHRLLPRLDVTVDYAWTGAFGQTTTGLPIIGKAPGMPHCWIALGYGGNGTIQRDRRRPDRQARC